MAIKIISFSLYGNNIKYQEGALENVKLAKAIYPDWKTRFYLGADVDEKMERELLKNGAEVIRKGLNDGISGMFWRFEPMFEANTIMLSRDVDSRLSIREKSAVDEWLRSGKKFHIMRDHPLHGQKIMGGMFGCINHSEIQKYKRIYLGFKKTSQYGDDQFFLSRVIYPIIKNDVLIHSKFTYYDNEKVKEFPIERNPGEFVGMTYTNNKPNFNYSISTYAPKKRVTTKRVQWQVFLFKVKRILNLIFK